MSDNKWRSVFISDVHLGTRGSNASGLYEFLKNNSSDNTYLVGDFFDIWKMSTGIYWQPVYNDLLSHLIKKRKNCIYITGNHDEYFRKFSPVELAGFRLADECVHTSANGKQYLVIHGDRFDGVTRYAKWLAILGSHGYNILIALNSTLNWFRKKLGMKYWSLSAAVKKRVKEAVSFISNFESALIHECNSRGYDGIICGHIHQPDVKIIKDILYLNTGDWVESSTAIVETHEGEFFLLDREGRPWKRKQ